MKRKNKIITPDQYVFNYYGWQRNPLIDRDSFITENKLVAMLFKLTAFHKFYERQPHFRYRAESNANYLFKPPNIPTPIM